MFQYRFGLLLKSTHTKHPIHFLKISKPRNITYLSVNLIGGSVMESKRNEFVSIVR